MFLRTKKEYFLLFNWLSIMQFNTLKLQNQPDLSSNPDFIIYQLYGVGDFCFSELYFFATAKCKE